LLVDDLAGIDVNEKQRLGPRRTDIKRCQDEPGARRQGKRACRNYEQLLQKRHDRQSICFEALA